MDILSPEERSERMALIKGKDTKPELVVRMLLRRMGYGYRLGGQGLPGKPDIVMSKRKTVIFVHGCFWHRHPGAGCRLARMPKSKLDYWEPKLAANVERDQRVQAELKAMGWRVHVVWECEMRDRKALARSLADVLGPAK